MDNDGFSDIKNDSENIDIEKADIPNTEISETDIHEINDVVLDDKHIAELGLESKAQSLEDEFQGKINELDISKELQSIIEQDIP